MLILSKQGRRHFIGNLIDLRNGCDDSASSEAWSERRYLGRSRALLDFGAPRRRANAPH